MVNEGLTHDSFLCFSFSFIPIFSVFGCYAVVRQRDCESSSAIERRFVFRLLLFLLSVSPGYHTFLLILISKISDHVLASPFAMPACQSLLFLLSWLFGFRNQWHVMPADSLINRGMGEGICFLNAAVISFYFSSSHFCLPFSRHVFFQSVDQDSKGKGTRFRRIWFVFIFSLTRWRIENSPLSYSIP